MSILSIGRDVEPIAPRRAARTSWTPGHVLAAIALVAATAAATGGLFARGFYTDGAWARSAFRGNDLATLALAVPVLATSLALSLRGSARARLVLLGMLAYGTYDFAFYVFGAEFSDWFLLHVAAFTSSALGLLVLAHEIALPHVALGSLGRRSIATYLGAVGAVMASLWTVESIRFAMTGELTSDAPRAGQHTVFAIDLSLLVPGLLLAAVLLWRRHPWGVPAAVAMNVLAIVYQVALMAGAQFQANAGVGDGGWFSPPSIAVVCLSVAALVHLLRATAPGR